MVRTRAVPRWGPNVNPNPRQQQPNVNQNPQSQQPDVDFKRQRVAATKELRRRVRVSDVKIKFLLPRVKNVEVKHRENVVRKMKVRRVAKHAAKKRNVRYG